jgi:hypothetical protein
MEANDLRDLLIVIRRALLLIVRYIESRYRLPPSGG